jgi:hypothetical protein
VEHGPSQAMATFTFVDLDQQASAVQFIVSQVE